MNRRLNITKELGAIGVHIDKVSFTFKLYCAFKRFFGNLRCGIKSRIPWHCVLFFSFLTLFEGYNYKHPIIECYNRMLKNKIKFYNGEYYDKEFEIPYDVQYVPCPICVSIGNFHLIKSCNLTEDECKTCCDEGIEFI